MISFYWGVGWQNVSDLASLSKEYLYDVSTLICLLIVVSVGLFLVGILMSPWINKNFIEHTPLELVWTIIPIVILSLEGTLSISTLLSSELLLEPSLSLKVTGHQWYWSYEYLELPSLSFDSYMVQVKDLTLGSFRNLAVDHHPVVPMGVVTRVVVTSTDVIHSWAVPSLTIKIDAVPGKLNSVLTKPIVPGVYMGMCSEICGTGHSFMPIVVEVTSPVLFKYWVLSQ